MINNNTPQIDTSKIENKRTKEKEEAQLNTNKKVKQLIELAQDADLPQIIIDTFTNVFVKISSLNIDNDNLIQRASLCYKEHSELIEKLPQDVAATFIYAYCVYEKEEQKIVKDYSYYKGYKDVFYLLHVKCGVFIIYNGISLQKDENKYMSDYSWGYIDLSGDDTFSEDRRVSGNTIQTAEVILSAIFPDNEEKLNLISSFIDTFLIENTTYQTNSFFRKEDILNWYNNMNLIKRVCLEYKLTYREFGEKVGFGEGAIKNAAASGKISDQLKQATGMYLEIQRLAKENKKFKKLQYLMREIVSL